MITLRQIQFALAVARHQHFKRAAEDCNISQSALSLGIAEMEKQLGVIMFERNNKQVLITPIGMELLERGQKIYLDAQQLVARAHAGQEALCFGMKLGFIPTIAPFLLPVILPIIRRNYPTFTLNISEANSERLIDAVRTGHLDAAVLALPFATDGLDTYAFGEENFLVLTHREDPLCKETKISSEQLQNLPLLLLEEGHCLSAHFLDACKLRHVIGKDNFKQATLNTLIQLAANGMGVTLIPEIARQHIHNYPTLHSVPLDAPGPHRRLALVTRPNYPRTGDLDILSTLFSEALKNLKQAHEAYPYPPEKSAP